MEIQSPKEFKLKIIPAKLACEYNELWHSLLPKLHWSNVVRNRDYVCFGTFYNDEIYAVGIWSSPPNRISDDGVTLELRRLAICEKAPKFTATWMLGKMIKSIKKNKKHISRLISYQDTNVHEGTIYKAGNWKPVHKTNHTDWVSRKNRKPVQTTAPKIRWEYYI